MSGHEAEGGSTSGARDTTVMPRGGPGPGRPLPLNSKRLIASVLKQIARGLEVPTTASLDAIRQLIDGKLEEMGRDPRSTQVIIEEGEKGIHVSLQDVDGVFLKVAPPAGELSEPTSSGDLEEGGGGSVSDQTELVEALQREVAQLKAELGAQKTRVREMWNSRSLIQP